MGILAYLNNLSTASAPVQPKAAGSDSGKRKRRVLIGKQQLYVTDEELSVILRQMLEEEAPAAKVVKPSDTPIAAPLEFFTPKYEQIARQQLRLGDMRTLDLLHALAFEAFEEEAIEMLLLH